MRKIIKVPNELKGQKIVPFIEKCLSERDWGYGLGDILTFLSQPFSVEMLVNPYSPKIEYDGIYQESIKHEVEAEEMRLFEGWEYKDGDFYYQGLRTIDSLIHYLETNSGDSWEFKSLNDFITLCQLAGVDLGVWK